MHARSFIAALAVTTACAANGASRPRVVELPQVGSEAARAPSEGAASGDATGSSDSAADGFLGATWGEDAAARAKRLGLRCTTWSPWEGNNPARGIAYDACFETDHPVHIYNVPAYARLFREPGGRLEGMTLRFTHSGALRASLVDAIRKGFGMEPSPEFPYEVYADDSLVRFACDSGDDSCELTVAGPVFGKVLAADILAQGFSELANGLRPH